MIVKYDANKVNSYIADVIHKYISDGYRIDHDKSVANEKGDCLFKAVLYKGSDDSKLSVTITLTESTISHVKKYTYHKIDSMGGINFGEEIRTYLSMTEDYTDDYTDDYTEDSTEGSTEDDLNDAESDTDDKETNSVEDNVDQCNLDDNSLNDSLRNCIIKTCSESNSFEDCQNKLIKLYNKINNYAIGGAVYSNKDESHKEFKKSNTNSTDHIKIGPNDTEKDIYDKITTKQNYKQNSKENFFTDPVVNKVVSTVSSKKIKDTDRFKKNDNSLDDYLNSFLCSLFNLL